jgi:hypothetical protein
MRGRPRWRRPSPPSSCARRASRLGAGADRVRVAPEDQGRRVDGSGDRRRGEQAVEHLPPHVGGHLAALHDHGLEEIGRHAVPGRAGDELAHEVRIDGVGQRLDLLAHRADGGRVGGEGAECANQDEPERSVWALHGEASGGVGGAGRADQHGGVDSKRVHERSDVGHQVPRPITAARPVRVPVAALAGRKSVEVVRQVFQDPLERAPRVEVGVQQQNGQAGGVPLLDVAQVHAGGQADSP